VGLGERVRFQVGDLTATGLPDASCDAVMSLDVLVFVPDKAAALREVARILRGTWPWRVGCWPTCPCGGMSSWSPEDGSVASVPAT
jgi:ubiquinone/menaquinone biosynthesis C-methylase UbiE